jgi:lipopolysaccharide export system permease protein
MNLLDRYIIRNFLFGMIPVLILLLVLFSFMALSAELEEVGKGLFTQFDALLVVLYTMPRRIVDLLPVTTLLGGLMGLGAMANHQELVAARVAGMSQARMAWPIFVLTLTLAMSVFLVQSLLVPLSEREANRLRAHALVETNLDSTGETEFWTRSGNNFVNIGSVRLGRLLSDIEIYATDEKGRFKRLVQAQSAFIASNNDWLLQEVSLTSVDGLVVHEEQRDELTWPGLLSNEQAAFLVLPLEALPPLDLARLIKFHQQNGLDAHRYRVVLWQQLSIMLAVMGMGLLALPMLTGSVRSISASQRIVFGGFVGIGFYLLQQVSGHLAGLFTLHPPTTIMAPTIILLLVAIYAQFLDAGRKRKGQRQARARVRKSTG